ncbi:MAG: hypothetical protein HUJ51_06465 [Eggerthellaceae bacterium]|nr:hypothetical protein [Eggerthellaceae bacterium]
MVIKLVDGDTINVVIGEDEYKVRFIGINAPESASSKKEKNCPEGKEVLNNLNSVVYRPMAHSFILNKMFLALTNMGVCFIIFRAVNLSEVNNYIRLSGNMVNTQLVEDG